MVMVSLAANRSNLGPQDLFAGIPRTGHYRRLILLQYCSASPTPLKFHAIHQSSIALSHARASEAPLEKPAGMLPE